MHFSGCKRQPLDFRKNPQLCSIIECSFSHSFLCNFYVPHWSPFVQCKNVHQPIITSHELWTTSFQEWRLPVSSNTICYSLIRDHSHSKFEAKMHFHLCAHHRAIISKYSYFLPRRSILTCFGKKLCNHLCQKQNNCRYQFNGLRPLHSQFQEKITSLTMFL